MFHYLTFIDIILLAAGLLLSFYLFITRNNGHFTKRKLPHVRPVPLFGFMLPVVLRRVTFVDQILKLYKELEKHRFGGVFSFMNPVVMLRDPEVIKQVTVKNFDHFVNHFSIVNEKQDPLFGKNLFSLQDDKWRNMRATLSPAFTTSKLRLMFTFMTEIGQQLVQHLQQECSKADPNHPDSFPTIEMKDLFTRFTNDVIATTAFGIQVDSLRDKRNEFYLTGKKISDLGGSRSLILMLYLVCPKLMEFLKVPFTEPGSLQFFQDLITNTINFRKNKGIIRPDMIHLLMEASKGRLKTEDDAGDDPDNIKDKTMKENKKTEGKLKLSDDDIAAQAMIFFIAGFETVATVLSFTTYLLAIHPEIQLHLQNEIDGLFEKANGCPSYEQIQNMVYLDMVISESLRYFPPVAAIDRKCSKTFLLKGSETEPDYIIKENNLIWIPVYAIHHDAKYYPNPEKFDPERFNEENRQFVNPFTYMPFGVGPRICIAQRFALLEVKLALTYLLRYFTIKPTPTTPIPPVLSMKGFQMSIKGGFGLKVQPRNKSYTNK